LLKFFELKICKDQYKKKNNELNTHSHGQIEPDN